MKSKDKSPTKKKNVGVDLESPELNNNNKSRMSLENDSNDDPHSLNNLRMTSNNVCNLTLKPVSFQ
jgi:hypothetical protein